MSDRDTAALQRAQSIAGQPSFLVLFGVCVLVTIAGVISLYTSGLWGLVVFGGIAALVAISVVTKQGDNIMMGVAGILAIISGFLAIGVLVFVMTGSASSAAERYGRTTPAAPAAGGGH
jgi:hypothetical protein